MAKKRKTLPKDFDELIETNDIKALKAVFDKCELEAYGGYGKQTALSAFNIPAELVRWLVEQGADIESRDIYDRTPLLNHCATRYGDIRIFLELGADSEAVDKRGNTPLHFAAAMSNLKAVELLIAKGVNPVAENNSNLTPLEKAIAEASNIDITDLEKIARILLKENPSITEKMQSGITRLGENFEFHRANFNKEYLVETSNALDNLYVLFNVIPVPRRMMHDGVAPIVPQATDWQEQYAELWDLLIPSSGAALTVQGEVIRITGKVRDELYRNGGGNWDTDFRKMLTSLMEHLKSANSLSDQQLEEAQGLIKSIKDDDSPTDLCRIALEWVLLNPSPIKLAEVPYKR